MKVFHENTNTLHDKKITRFRDEKPSSSLTAMKVLQAINLRFSLFFVIEFFWIL